MQETTETKLIVTDHRFPEVQEEKPQQEVTTELMVMTAMEKGMSPELISRMMDLRDREEKYQAKKAFYQAKSAFNENPPEVLKDKENSQFSKGDKKAMYTSLGNLLKTVNPALGKHGLSASFDIQQSEGIITVSCCLSHSMGHTEKVTLSAPPDTSGGNSKNPVQQIKSTITYLRAATFEAAAGIAATDSNMDDDGNGSGDEPKYITEDQVKEIEAILNEKNVDTDEFFKWAKVDKLEDIQIKNYQLVFNTAKKAKGRPKTVKCPEFEGKKDIPISDCETCKMKEGCPEWS
jgi:hypothetical protein